MTHSFPTRRSSDLGFDLSAGYQVCVGGSWNLARGLHERFLQAGGKFINHAEVARIVVDGGRATGVELSDGRSFRRSEEHTSELQSLMRISYAVFCLTKKLNAYTITSVNESI